MNEKEQLLEAIKFFNFKGWSPATSTNYSIKEDEDLICISRSGVDKSLFCENDLIHINSKKQLQQDYPSSYRPSAETDIHLFLYETFPNCRCVLHTHSVNGTMLSMGQKKLDIEGLEILKGLEGNTTHLMTEVIPVVKNSQEMKSIIQDIAPLLDVNTHGFLIEGHGLYTWGKDVATTKRHIETFEFIFECLSR